MRSTILSAIFLCYGLILTAQSLPRTQVHCFDLEKFGDQITLKNPRYLTSFNQYGYNNQPAWINNNELYLSVMTRIDTFQTDIYSLSFLNNTLTRITATPESEYSPTLMPDRKHFSCVRVDANRSATQRLWAYPIDRTDAGYEILPLHQSIGYHFWLTEKKLALFIVNGTTNYLKLVNTDDQSAVQLTQGIGRSFGKLPDGRLAFIQKATKETWYIRALDPITNNMTTIISCLPNSEDFVLMPDGTFLMGNQGKLFAYKFGDIPVEWREIANLTSLGISNIRRMAINRDLDRIAIVSDVRY